MRQSGRRPNQQRSELASALAACRGAFISIGLMSGMSNILMLTGSIFMLEVYDRVLPSRSVPTLVGLVILAAGLFTAQGLLDLIRGRILVRIGSRLDEALSGRVYETIVRLPLKVGNRSDGLQPLRDLDSVRSFLSGARPDRAVRPALDADLSGDLLPVPSLDRADRAARRDHSRRHHPADRDDDTRADAGRNQLRASRAIARRGEPPQRRGAHGHGHDRPHRGALGRSQRASTWRASSAPATSPADSARRPRCCA